MRKRYDELAAELEFRTGLAEFITTVSTQLQSYTRGVMLQSLIMATFCAIGFSCHRPGDTAVDGCDYRAVQSGALYWTGHFDRAGDAGRRRNDAVRSRRCSTSAQSSSSAHKFSTMSWSFHRSSPTPSTCTRYRPFSVSSYSATCSAPVGIILAVPAIAAGKIVFKNIYADMANASLRATPASS